MKRRKNGKKKLSVSEDLWINPRLNLRGTDGNRAGDNQGNISPNSGARFLELADVALGLKKPSTPGRRKNRLRQALTDQPKETETSST